MIYDEISQIGRYRGLFKGLDVLIDWLAENDYKALPVGTTPILGEKVYASVQTPTTLPASEKRFETHQRYMDVQVDVEGREAFRVGQGAYDVSQPYDAGSDIDFGDAERFVQGDLDCDRFVLYLVGEPHMPNVEFPGDGSRDIKKICFKVAIDGVMDEA